MQRFTGGQMPALFARMQVAAFCQTSSSTHSCAASASPALERDPVPAMKPVAQRPYPWAVNVAAGWVRLPRIQS
ncbi:hypothetical protein MPNT_200052 [Candidatus Methylacidithermus pantelleriae]|uniref:Uncharacterized protein n=1 Tax=Candidatus Methylacidithermus pantelleriae TaxID=2744239 RepID=A0A8J2BSL8_9BACT|nr:hypothetical protein MPNT_200052 [Candidatus Methylacidithermus pantelleriae]